ncbi:RHS repeat-associated core domain-containing protein, partial [Pararcticibacter amylolyticus]
GSEWQNDYGDLPDYYQTYYRNYDAALGRFLGVDPMAEASDAVSTYHYSGNNPVMYNDPLGDKKLEALPPHGSGSSWGAGTGLNQAVLDLAWAYWSVTPEDGKTYTYDDPASGFEWSPWAGGRITQEEWLARGGDPKLLATAVNPQFYSGGWVKKVTVTSTKTAPVNANTNSGGESSWLKTTSDIFGAAGLGMAAKTELLEWAVRSSYKSNNTREGWDLLRKTQKAWRTTNTLGKTGAKYLKFAKGLGVAGEVVGVASAGYQLINDPTAGNATRLAVQGAAIGAAFIPVVGWGISLGISTADMIWGDDFYKWIDEK